MASPQYPSLSERELRASIQEVRSVAVSADGRSKAIVANLTDVNGRIIGTVSENDGESDSYTVISSKFALEDPDGTAETSFANGRWTNPDAAAGTRTVYGRAFGGDQKLEWWTGPASVAEGAETKSNAYVYISRNTVGGPRFGGSDTPGGALVPAKITNFSGNVGRPAPLMVAGQTEAVTVPQNGRFIVEMTNGLTSSFSDSAGGLLRLYISKDGAETLLGSLNVNAGGGDFYFDLSALNMEVVHNFAGAVKFVVKTNGSGPSTDGQGTVSGTLKATFYPN